MHYRLNELLDIPSLQKLLEHLSRNSGMVAAILDTEGEILLAVGWQDICTKFHRVCPQTECRCRQSDKYLKEHLHEKPYIVYKCLNGLTDCAVPIIVNNHHLGTFFTGQFLSAPPDEEFFRRQAREYGFDESAYINALYRVPIINEHDMEITMEFYTQLTLILSAMGRQRMIQLETTEERFRKSEERLRLALEGSDNGFWDWNLETGDLYYSPSWHRMLGYSEGQIEAGIEGWAKLIHDDDRSYVIKRINEHIQGNTPQYEAEYRLLTNSGEWKWVQGVGKVVARDKYNRALRMTGLTTDINERKNAERQLQEERNFNAALLDTAGDLIAVTDHEGRIVLFNQVCEQISGYSVNEVKGKYIWEMLAPEDIEHGKSLFDQPMDDLDSAGSKLKFENHWLTKDGEHRLISWTITFLYDEKGLNSHVIGAGTDITERKQAEVALIESERRFREMLKNVKLIAGSMDIEGRITFCNDFFLDLLGWSWKDVIGKSWVETFVPSEIRERDQRIISTSLERGMAPNYGESEIMTAHGERRTVLWNNILLLNPDGSSAGFAGIGEDITERRAAKERSQELMLELELANRELKEFAYIVSHDLKAPLRGIRSLADWIYADNKGKFDEVGQEQLNLLVNRTTRMHNLLEGILKYSRLSHNEEQKTEIELNEVIREVIEMLAPPDNISIIIENELPLVIFEKTRIIQLFENLLSNAIKYMDKQMGVIKISCQSQQDWWQFSIKDNGPGIEERYFDKIFTIFQTLKSRDEFESTGIGLTIVKKIVGMYGGNVWVESKIGIGSTFHFTLPAL